MTEQNVLERIVTDPQIFGGKPVVRGRRLAVEHVLGMLAAGDEPAEILEHCARSLSTSGDLADVSWPGWRQRAEAVDVDRGQLVWRRLKNVAAVVHLHELGPVGGRAAGGRDRRRVELFAEVCEGLTSRGRSHPGLLPLAYLRFEVSRLLPAVFSEPDVTAALYHWFSVGRKYDAPEFTAGAVPLVEPFSV